MRNIIEEIIRDKLVNNLQRTFQEFLKMALDIWDYRVSKGGSPYGIEYIFQTFLAKEIIERLDGSLNLYISQSVKHIVVNYNSYKENLDIFKMGDRYIQPDIVIANGKGKILEILEIKCIEKGNLNWIFNGEGKEYNKYKGDICKLLRIKNKYHDINCYELIINRGGWETNTWGKRLFDDLLHNSLLEIILEEKISGFESLDIKLVEIKNPQNNQNRQLFIDTCYKED